MNPSLIAFLSYLISERGLSDNTVAAYRNDLNQFLEFILRIKQFHPNHNPCPFIRRDEIIEYFLELQKRSYSLSTTSRKIATLKSFFGFMMDEGTIREDPTMNLSTPRKGPTLPKSLSEDEMLSLLLEASKGPIIQSKRNLAMLELMYATGIRVSEMTSLNIQDINYEENYLRCLGKGSKERLISMHDEALSVVETYVKFSRPILMSKRKNKQNKEDALFLNHRGERMTRQSFWLIVKHCAEKTGIITNISPHTIRHSFATHMLKRGAPLRFLQELLGHSSISTTQIYTHLEQDHIRKEYDESHPRS